MFDLEIKNDLIKDVMERLEGVLHGKRSVLVRILICAFCGGHILLEDVPGLG